MSKFDKYRVKFSLTQPISLVGEGIVEERGNQIISMIDELSSYNIFIKDLVNECPSINIRNKVLNIAYYIVEESEYYDNLIKNKELSIDEISANIKIEKSFLELWQEYIIAYVVILGNPNYKYINDYLRIEENVDILGIKKLIEHKSDIEIRGIAISKSKRKVVILTSKGEFKKINVEEAIEIGEEISGDEAKSWRNYKLHISIISILIFSMIAAIGIKYTTVTKTVVINTTSLIKVEVNSFERVINAQSPTVKGAEMLENINIQDKYIDESLYEIFKYVLENEMIPNDDILVTVSGKMIEIETVEKTKEFLEENNIKVKFNNSGNEYYINQ